MELIRPTSLLQLLPALFLVAVAFFSFAWVWRSISEKGRLYHPVASNVFQASLEFSRLYDFLTELSRRHKSFRILTSPFHSDIYTNDPALVKHILDTNSHNYVKGECLHEILEDLLGDGIFTVDGAKWLQQRKLFSHEFSTRALREVSATIFRKNGVRLANAIAGAVDSRRAIDIQEWFSKATMDTIFEVSFGAELNNLLETKGETREFVRVFGEASELINQRFYNPFWKIKRFFNLGSEGILRKNIVIINDYMYKLLRSKIAHLSDQMAMDDVLSRVLFDREKNPEFMSLRYLTDVFFNFLIAGKDTPACTLTWLFYLICKNPRVQERLYREVLEAVGSDGKLSIEEFGAKLSDESLQKLKYLHAAITETLRLYPGIATDFKCCLADDVLPDGCCVKAGELIHYLPYCMGRMKYLWGEDAEMFKPERWLDENGDFLPRTPFKFPVFQAGRRMCPGKEFAYQEMKIFAAVLLRFFVFELRNEEESVHYKMTLTLYKNQGLDVYVLRR